MRDDWCGMIGVGRIAQVSIDMASFEVVQYCWPTLERLLTERKLHTVFANEEEAAAVVAQSAAKHPNGTLAATAVDLSTKSSNTGLGGDSLDCQVHCRGIAFARPPEP
jgi:hypothetical protein